MLVFYETVPKLHINILQIFNLQSFFRLQVYLQCSFYLQSYLNVLVLNGYHNLDSLKGLQDQDLIALGIVNADHRLKLLNAIEKSEGNIVIFRFEIKNKLLLCTTSHCCQPLKSLKSLKTFCIK